MQPRTWRCSRILVPLLRIAERPEVEGGRIGHGQHQEQHFDDEGAVAYQLHGI